VLDSLSNNDVMEKNETARMEALNFKTFNIVSGTALSFYINITD